MQQADSSEASHGRRIIKGSVSRILVESIFLVREVGYNHVGPAVDVVILKVDSHARKCSAAAVKTHARNNSNFFEGAVPFVMEEKLRDGIIRQHNIHPAIVIVVCDRK